MKPEILRLEHIEKKFGNLTVLNDLSFTIQEGEIFGLVGPNGAGKSTIVNLISCLIPPLKGDILFFEKSICGLKPHQISQIGIGRTFQNPNSNSNITALESVLGGALFGRTGKKKTLKDSRKRSIDLLKEMGLGKKKNSKVESLTVPERKKLEIAKALATDPILLILDEVLDGLNSTEIKEWIELVKKIRDSGITLMIIEHLIRVVAEVCDRIIVIDRGQKIIEGPPAMVLNDPKVLRVYLGKRFEG